MLSETLCCIVLPAERARAELAATPPDLFFSPAGLFVCLTSGLRVRFGRRGRQHKPGKGGEDQGASEEFRVPLPRKGDAERLVRERGSAGRRGGARCGGGIAIGTGGGGGGGSCQLPAAASPGGKEEGGEEIAHRRYWDWPCRGGVAASAACTATAACVRFLHARRSSQQQQQPVHAGRWDEYVLVTADADRGWTGGVT